MPRKREFEKVTLRLRPGDREYIIENFPDTPMNQIVRKLVSNFVDRHGAGLKNANIEVEV